MEFGVIDLLIFLALCINLGTAQDPTFVGTSYRAIGEIILQASPNDVVALAFEENFDYESRQAVFTVYSAGFSTTLVEDMNLNQTLKYNAELVDGEIVTNCSVYTSLEWRNVHTPPDLELFEYKQESVFFPMMQLFWGLSPRFLNREMNVTSKSYRDIPCYMLPYRLNYTNSNKTVDYVVDIEAYWSNGEWNTSAKENVVPIGFKIHHNGVNKTSGKPVTMDQYVNVMYFTRDNFNKEAFLPKQGIFCPGRKSSKPFPQFGDFTALSASMEFVWKSYQIVSTIDMNIDTSSKMVQVYYDPMNQDYDPLNGKRKISSVLIANHNQMIAYDKRGDTCQVIPLKKVDYDIQTIYDTDFLSELTAERVFGRTVNYVYIGETIKRGIPCHMWQGERRGWPPTTPTITTVWEWCIAERVGNPIMFENGALPFVSLDITVTESHLTTSAGAYIRGTQLSYNFYNVIARTPSYLRSFEFDISPCFSDQYTEWLQFKVDVTWTKNSLKNATVYANFVDRWRTTIYEAIRIEPSTMRVAKVRTLLEDKVLFVQFRLLDRHPDTPTYIKKDADLKEAKNRLKLVLDKGSLSIDWQSMTLKGLSGSLETAFERRESTSTTQNIESYATQSSSSDSPISPKSSPVVTPSESKSTPSDSPISPKSSPVVTPSESKSTSSRSSKPQPSSPGLTDVTEELVTVTDTPKETKRSTEKRHTSGTMAGLGIGMLLLGFSLGAGGTFAKFRYLPSIW